MSFRPRSYPHPVLSPYSRDYIDGSEFYGEFDRDSADGKLEISYRINLKSDRLDEFRLDGHAKLALSIYSKGSRWKKLEIVSGLAGKVTIPETNVFGTIEVTPLLVTTTAGRLELDGINHEYSTKTFPFEEGDILALGPTEAMESDHEPSSTDSEDWIVFRLNEAMGPDEYSITPANDVILVFVGANIMRLTNYLRANPNFRPFLFLSFYKDAFVAAIDAILENYHDNEDLDQPWAIGLQAYLDANDMSLEEIEGRDRDSIQRFVVRMLAKDGSGELVKRLAEGNALA